MCTISETEIDNLKDAEYIVLDGDVHVKAVEITNKQQIFICPFCYDDPHYHYRKSDGESDTQENAVRRTLHYHSYNRSFRQNLTVPLPQKTHIYMKKTPHCGLRYAATKHFNGKKCFPRKYVQFCIHITTTTKDSRKNNNQNKKRMYKSNLKK
jgi:hypothetical protein